MAKAPGNVTANNVKTIVSFYTALQQPDLQALMSFLTLVEIWLFTRRSELLVTGHNSLATMRSRDFSGNFIVLSRE